MTVWYFARGAGLAALVLLSVSTALGALVSRHGSARRRYVVQYLHRATAALGITVLALHIGLMLLDSYAHVGWIGALVPFGSDYRPTWVALGTLAAYLFVFVSALGLYVACLVGVLGATAWRIHTVLAVRGRSTDRSGGRFADRAPIATSRVTPDETPLPGGVPLSVRGMR